MTKLIINADDFGYTEGVNVGIISAYKNGVVSSTTMMSAMPGFEQGVELLKENPGLGCGVHMTLSCYKPLLKKHKTIVDENGYFYKRITNESLEDMDMNEIYEEFCAQIDRVIESGVKITHLDSHHHVHGLLKLNPVIKKILNKYRLPIRGGFEYNLDYKKIIPVVDTFYANNVDYDYFEKNIEELKKYEIADIMTHPAFVDEFLLNSTSYAIPRTKEHKILTSENVKKVLEKNNITLVNYSDKSILENKN
ncbi:chitin disaccharide deacetylase [Clostridium sp. CCUG 7971]|uniref:chitin disaccharide deacetylase n=1 Tax=Clostridium sp. CCUG 7971 TaxID=2811414 RepID=UPI001ABBA37D|nr:chitin disaccharide deacetylase [Clostridium sp. CCUG 7971]MBO3443639.1 chitin disaccharide deacetylase [Clostridium sp. CCUG 7971]